MDDANTTTTGRGAFPAVAGTVAAAALELLITARMRRVVQVSRAPVSDVFDAFGVHAVGIRAEVGVG